MQPVGLPADVKKYKITNFKCFLRLSEALTPRKEVIFELSMKFCIGRCQNPKINFFLICCTFFAGVHPPEKYGIPDYSRMYRMASAHTLQKLTGCLASCQRRNYRLLLDTERFRIKPTNGSKALNLTLYYPHGEYESKEEVRQMQDIYMYVCQIYPQVPFQYIIYDHTSFVADVGGYLGLLIGQSMFSMYVMAEEWVRWRMGKKRLDPEN